MAFFRTYLIQNNETPNTSFNEDDEAALILFLLYARLQRSGEEVRVPDGFTAPEDMPEELADSHSQRELRFVAGFVCFFVVKPAGYMRDMRDFQEYYVPGFASDTAKQIQLAGSLRKEFFEATLDDLTEAQSLDRFSDTTTIKIVA